MTQNGYENVYVCWIIALLHGFMPTYLFSHVCNKYDMFICYGHCNCVFRVKIDGLRLSEVYFIDARYDKLLRWYKFSTQNIVNVLYSNKYVRIKVKLNFSLSISSIFPARFNSSFPSLLFSIFWIPLFPYLVTKLQFIDLVSLTNANGNTLQTIWTFKLTAGWNVVRSVTLDSYWIWKH